MKLPKALERVVENFEKLPGIGPKTAQRLAFYLLHVPQNELEDFSHSLSNLKNQTVLCSTCFNIGEADPCFICADSSRDSSTICIVEDALDLLAVERSGKYKGLYHVLHGVIDPLNSIGPDDIYLPQLMVRIKDKAEIKELILATNPTMEGEATSLYIVREFSKDTSNGSSKVKITRIGRGLPIGSDIEYADEVTIERALEGRREY